MGQFADLFDDAQPDDRARAAMRLSFASGTKPDEAAKAAALARRYGLPPAVVEQYRPDYERRAAVDDARPVLEQAPKLRGWLAASETNAVLAQDDLPTLGSLERTLRAYTGAFGEGVVGQGAGSLLSGAGRLYDAAARGLAAPLIALGGEPVRRVLESPIPDWASPSRVFLTRPGESLKAAGRAIGPAPEERTFGLDVASGIGQLTFQVAQTLATGGAGGMLGLMAQGADSVAAKVDGDAAPQAAKDAAVIAGGAVTGALEKYSIDKILGPLAVPIRNRVAAAMARVGIAAGAEGGSEAVESVLQDALRVALTNRDAGIDLGDAAYEGGVGGTVGAIARTLVESALHIRRRGQRADDQVRRAESDLQALGNLATSAEASRLKARDQVAFERLVADLADNREVFIPADTLAQTLGPDLDAVVQAVPALAAIDEALANGDLVAVPLSEFLAHVPSDAARALLPHVRSTPDALSLDEASTLGQDARSEMERIAAELEADLAVDEQAIARQQGFEAVRAAVSQQIAVTGRFTREVGGTYATLVARFFEAAAERTGLDADRLYRDYQPTIVSQLAPDTHGQFDQQPSSEDFRQWADGTQTRYLFRDPASGAFTDDRVDPEDGGNYVRLANPLEVDLTDDTFDLADMPGLLDVARAAGHDGVVLRGFREERAPRDPAEQMAASLSDALSQFGFDVGRRVFFGPARTLYVPLDAGQIRGARRIGDMLEADSPAVFEQNRRGAYDPSTRTIALLESADLSTFLHEAAHYFFDITVAMAKDSPRVRESLEPVWRWFGDGVDFARWQRMTLEEQRPYHERFARGFEAYLFEGESPSPEMQTLFHRFRSWLLRVYRDIRALDVELTADVRAVMDRMLATDEQIRATEAARRYAPLFESAEAAGMTPDEFADYQRTGAQATADAVEDLQRRSLRDLAWYANAKGRALTAIRKKARAQREAIEAEVAAEVRETPVFAAVRWLKTGELPDGTQTTGAKLSGKALAELYGDGPATPRRYLSTDLVAAEGGMHPDQVAEMFPNPDGSPAFDSGDALVRAIVEAGREADVIEARTDQRMLEEFGDLVDERAVERAAEAAVNNDARARMLEREVGALAKAVGNRPTLLRAAREAAEQATARKVIAKVRPALHAAAETRAARESESAFRKGATAEAASRKREQLLQNQLHRASLRALDEVERGVDYLRRFETDASRRAIGPDYAEQIDALLERVDLRRSTSARDIARRKSLAEWVEAQRAQGFEPNLDEALLADASLTSYRELTVEQFRGLVDTVKNIEHLGRLKQRLLTARDERQFDAIVEDVAASIVEHGGDARPVALERERGVVPWLRGVWASHRKIASLARQMDGGRDGGPLWRALVRGMNDAGTREATMVEQATERLGELYAPILALPGGTAGGKVFVPEVGASLSRGARLAVALNWGNESNRQRLMDGEGWTEAQVEAILRTLGRTELDFVNQVWEFVDSYWPAIEAKQLRVDGIAEQKVQAQPFALEAGGEPVSMRGGYYPLKYDADRSSRAESLEAAEVAKDMMRGAFARATTRRGHTKARAESVKRPVRKDLDVLTEHVTQVVHDLAWHEWLIDANRLLGAKPIDAAIRRYYGPEVVRTLKDDILGIATGDAVAQSAIDRGLRALRANVSRSTMGLSFTTAMLQPFGLTQSMVRIGVRPVLRGVARWAGDAARFESSLAWIGEKSDFMRLRSKTFNRELSEISGRVGGQSAAMQTIDGTLFFLTTKMQMIADVPTWIGRYEKAIEEGADEAVAVALADQAVLDAQGGGQIKDLAEVQRRHPMLTQFYSYFSTTLNLAAESTARTDFRNPQAVAGWLADMALLIAIPAIAPALVLSALRGEDDDPEELAKKLAQAQAGYLLGLFVGARELSGVVSGFTYSGPPVGRIVVDSSKAAEQVAQGELDEPAVLAIVRLLGTAFGVPTVQAIRSYKGWLAWSEGDAPATAVLFGPPAKD